MHTIQQSYRGLSLVFHLNADWLVNILTLAIALMAGAYLGSFLPF